MDIKNDFPPNYEEILKHFDVSSEDVVFTYGNVIYNPKHLTLSDHLVIHERVHAKQQKEMGVEAWWEKYFYSPEFRLQQEIEAYGAQYRFVKDQEDYTAATKKAFLTELAFDLSGSIYGNIINYQKAESAIRIAAK